MAFEGDIAFAEDAGRVAGSEGKDVGAGDDTRADRLHGLLDRVDELKATHGLVVRGAELLWRRAERCRVEEDGSVATLNHHSSAI
jgi:hypothetical protein